MAPPVLKAFEFLARLNFERYAPEVGEQYGQLRAPRNVNAIRNARWTAATAATAKIGTTRRGGGGDDDGGGATKESSSVPSPPTDTNAHGAADGADAAPRDDGACEFSLPARIFTPPPLPSPTTTTQTKPATGAIVAAAGARQPARSGSALAHAGANAPRASPTTAGAPSLGTILLVHGMAPSGYDDVRMAGVARALASVGYTCVMPNFSHFQRCCISLDALDDIAWSIVAVAHCGAICGHGSHGDSSGSSSSSSSSSGGARISLFAACIAAGFSLCATAREARARRCVNAILCIGAYASVHDVVRTTMMRADNDDGGGGGGDARLDDYGRNAIMYNFLHYSLCDDGNDDADRDCRVRPDRDAPPSPRYDDEFIAQLRHALLVALHDSHYMRCGTDAEQLPAFLDKVRRERGNGDDSVRRMYIRLSTDAAFRRYHAERIVRHPRVRALMDECQPLRMVPALQGMVAAGGDGTGTDDDARGAAADAETNDDDDDDEQQQRGVFVALVHGERDDIVPSSESAALFNAIVARQRQLTEQRRQWFAHSRRQRKQPQQSARTDNNGKEGAVLPPPLHRLPRPALEVTALLNHGDKSAMSVAQLPAVLRLARVFRAFFVHASATTRGGAAKRNLTSSSSSSSPLTTTTALSEQNRVHLFTRIAAYMTPRDTKRQRHGAAVTLRTHS